MRTQRRPGRPIFAVGRAVLITTVLVASTAVLAAGESDAAVPTGFADTVVISGLTNPTAVQFAADGRIFVAQKNGQIYSFDASGGSKTLFADLSVAVDDFWDRGLLGLALSPTFPNDPAVYVLYTYDAPPGATAPRWNDGCPTPPGATTDGCVVSGRLSKLTPSGDAWATGGDGARVGMVPTVPQPLVGTVPLRRRRLPLRRAPVTAPASTMSTTASTATPTPAIRPTRAAILRHRPARRLTPPSAEGGALRSQSVRRTDGPATLDGTIIRVDPTTGAGVATNPFASQHRSQQAACARLRHAQPVPVHDAPGHERAVGRRRRLEHLGGDQPRRRHHERRGDELRMAVLRGEPDPVRATSRRTSHRATRCTATPRRCTAPFYAYNHSSQVVSGETCPTGGSSITGVAFYTGGSYPASYNGGLFFADHTRHCIWFMPAGANGVPRSVARADLRAIGR